MTDLGWDYSASGWINSMGDIGDVSRAYVLDAPMTKALPDHGEVLDIGCGEGRFCRMVQARGLKSTGLDPTVGLLDQARALDPKGTYVEGTAEDLPFEDGRFDAAVFYLSLIDIPDFRKGIREAARVLKRGGRLLIGNLHSYVTARPRNWAYEGGHWVEQNGTRKYLAMDDMMVERPIISAWSGMRLENYHRPLSAYMATLLDAGLVLRKFEDPPCTGPDQQTIDRFHRMPWAFFMAWDKPETAI